MKYNKKIKIMYEMFEEAFQASTPKASFYELLEKAPLDKDGRKLIDFQSYVCDHEVMENILKTTLKKYKITNTRDKKDFEIGFWLGPSPKSYHKELNNKSTIEINNNVNNSKSKFKIITDICNFFTFKNLKKYGTKW